jgi:hypothetical protein
LNLTNDLPVDVKFQWINDLEYINTTMRSIRKVQMDCNLLDLCVNKPGTMEKEFDGYVFDKLEREDGLYQFMVFLPELKLSSRITTRENIDNFELYNTKNNIEKINNEIDDVTRFITAYIILIFMSIYVLSQSIKSNFTIIATIIILIFIFYISTHVVKKKLE